VAASGSAGLAALAEAAEAAEAAAPPEEVAGGEEEAPSCRPCEDTPLKKTAGRYACRHNQCGFHKTGSVVVQHEKAQLHKRRDDDDSSQLCVDRHQCNVPRRVGEPDWGHTADACQEVTLECLWGSCTKPYRVADSLNRHVKNLTAPRGEHWRHILCRDTSDGGDCTCTITASFPGCAAFIRHKDHQGIKKIRNVLVCKECNARDGFERCVQHMRSQEDLDRKLAVALKVRYDWPA